MTKLSTSDWIQIVSGVAVICGILVVIYEIRQSRVVAEAQLMTDQHGIVTSVQSALVGEEAARIIAKACDDPAGLTTAETEVLNARYRTLLSGLILRKRVPVETGLLENDNWEQATRNVAGGILGTPYGRFWWDYQRDYWVKSAHPRIAEIFDSVRAASADGCAWQDSHDRYINSLRDTADA